MQVDADVKGSQALITVVGEVDAHTSPELERGLAQAIDQGVTAIVVDVSQMSFIDSSGLRVLVQAVRRVEDADGRLELRSPSDTVVRLLEITGLRELLKTG